MYIFYYLHRPKHKFCKSTTYYQQSESNSHFSRSVKWSRRIRKQSSEGDKACIEGCILCYLEFRTCLWNRAISLVGRMRSDRRRLVEELLMAGHVIKRKWHWGLHSTLRLQDLPAGPACMRHAEQTAAGACVLGRPWQTGSAEMPWKRTESFC